MNNYVWLRNVGVGLFLSVAGVPLTIVGVLVLRQSWWEKRTWTTVSGTVIGYKEESFGKSRSYAPQVQFASVDGKMVTFTSSISSGIKFRRIGTSVQVLYDPGDPEKAAIKSFSNRFLPGIVVIVLGVTLVGIALRPIFFK